LKRKTFQLTYEICPSANAKQRASGPSSAAPAASAAAAAAATSLAASNAVLSGSDFGLLHVLASPRSHRTWYVCPSEILPACFGWCAIYDVRTQLCFYVNRQGTILKHDSKVFDKYASKHDSLEWTSSIPIPGSLSSATDESAWYHLPPLPSSSLLVLEVDGGSPLRLIGGDDAVEFPFVALGDGAAANVGKTAEETMAEYTKVLQHCRCVPS
jgi:hypothetical protein